MSDIKKKVTKVDNEFMEALDAVEKGRTTSRIMFIVIMIILGGAYFAIGNLIYQTAQYADQFIGK